ncbi:MAG: ABC transporter permease, partial [Chloroflexi bacterium]
MPETSRTLWNVGWRTLVRHPWQTALMILGIALGVGVAVAVDLANSSAARAFDYSTDAVAGRATHQAVAGSQGLDEGLYVAYRRGGLDPGTAAAPVISEYFSSLQRGGRPLQLLGIEPLAEAPFRSYLWGEGGVPVDQLAALLTRPGALLLSSEMAARYGLAPGASLSIEVGGYERQAFLAGLLEPADDLSRRALDGLLLADVATAQEITGRLGRLDRIDLILPEGDAARQRLEA